MEEILHQVGYIKPCKQWEKLLTSTGGCRISEPSRVWQRMGRTAPSKLTRLNTTGNLQPQMDLRPTHVSSSFNLTKHSVVRESFLKWIEIYSIILLCGGFKVFCFHPCLRKCSNLTIIFFNFSGSIHQVQV